MLIGKDYCDKDTGFILRELGYNPYMFYDDGTPAIHLWYAQKFLREEKKLHITIFSQSQESWQYRITKPHQRLEDGLHGEDFTSYEDALSEGLRAAIKILKEK